MFLPAGAKLAAPQGGSTCAGITAVLCFCPWALNPALGSPPAPLTDSLKSSILVRPLVTPGAYLHCQTQTISNRWGDSGKSQEGLQMDSRISVQSCGAGKPLSSGCSGTD